jgi:ribosome-associated toxin RatA of RatAB toxin-antitoxin module
MQRRGFLHAASAALATTLLPGVALADRSVAESYRKPRAGSKVDVGGAMIGVNAPMNDVLKVVMKYRKYHTILPRLKTSKVMARKGNTSDVYMRAPILRGMFNIWAVTKFSGPLPWGKHGKKIIGKMTKGNVEAFDGVWKLNACGSRRCIVRLELFLIPKVPVPTSWITPELEWASRKGVTAVRDMAECGHLR